MLSRRAAILMPAIFSAGLLLAQAPPDLDPKAVMAKATEDLIKSGQAGRAIHQVRVEVYPA
jgi:hypothetical protein